MPSTSPLNPQMVEQMAVVQQELNTVVQIIQQDIAEVEAIVVQKVDQFLGIPTGSGTGGGASSSAATTNPQPSGGSQAAGNGSGSGAAITAKDSNPTAGGSNVQPASTGGGSGSGSIFTWDPHEYGSGTGGGGSGIANYDWTNYHNWLVNGQPQNGTWGYIPHKSTDTAIFDGEVNNSECIVNLNTTQGTIVLENGFTAPLEIQGSGSALNVSGYVDENIGLDNFNVVFLTSDDPLNVVDSQQYQIITPGNWNVGAGGQFNIDKQDNSGTGGIIFGIGANLKQSSASPINVKNGELIFGDGKNSGGGNYSTFQLTDPSANITVSGGSHLDFNQTGTQLINSSTNNTPFPVISNYGTASLQGVQGAGLTNIQTPFQNHASLYVQGGTWSFTLGDADGNDLSMDTGKISLNIGSTITLGQYTQTGGGFYVEDANETFRATGTANFNGGTLNFTNSSGPGILNTWEVVFNGVTLNMRIWADSSNSDEINSTSTPTTTIKGNSTINVTLIGAQTGYSSWALISSSGGITGDFNPVNLPAGIYEDYTEGGTGWDCQSTD